MLTIYMTDGTKLGGDQNMSIDHSRLAHDVAKLNGTGPDDDVPSDPPSDPLADAVRALKMAELALMSNLAGVTARRAEIKKLRGDVARLFFETMGKKARTRKAAK